LPLARKLLEARLQSELRSKPSREVSEPEITRDWNLLQQTVSASGPPLTARSAQQPDTAQGSQ
ncbi:MAG TPA: hypothetical protein VMD76_10800, partial [Candidatus Sulfotelmatobacter sp.]|nr:hypothetical protein [Candidatus Sulfotelmatobacter sp.]